MTNTGYGAMPELIQRKYAANKAMWEAQPDKNSDVAKRATTENQQIRDIYGIGADDMNYRTFNNNVINGGLLNNSNKYMKKLDSTYKSPYQQQLELDANAIRNFQYNPDTDPNFKAYADMYARQGAAAQDKTYSNLTALSGGRNNSWASAATAQVGQAYAQKTADMIPQLAEQAYNKLLQRYNISKDMDNTAYGRYADQWNRDKALSDTLYNRYDNEWNRTLTEQQHAKNMRDSDMNYQRALTELKKANIELEALPEQLQLAIRQGNITVEQLQEELNLLRRYQPQIYEKQLREYDDNHLYSEAQRAKIYGGLGSNNYTGSYGIDVNDYSGETVTDDELAAYLLRAANPLMK